MPSYTIPKERCDFIRKHFFQWSFSEGGQGQPPSKNDFLKLDHPADLFYLAYIYNWDDGVTVLEWVLESPLCTRSTANLIFWRCAPDWYLKFALDDLEAGSTERDGLIVLRKIVEKYRDNDFSTFQIEFDPNSELEKITTKAPKWEFPKGVYDKIEGVEICCDE